MASPPPDAPPAPLEAEVSVNVLFHDEDDPSAEEVAMQQPGSPHAARVWNRMQAEQRARLAAAAARDSQPMSAASQPDPRWLSVPKAFSAPVSKANSRSPSVSAFMFTPAGSVGGGSGAMSARSSFAATNAPPPSEADAFESPDDLLEPDLDYEHSGQGFVSRRSVNRRPTLEQQRRRATMSARHATEVDRIAPLSTQPGHQRKKTQDSQPGGPALGVEDLGHVSVTMGAIGAGERGGDGVEMADLKGLLRDIEEQKTTQQQQGDTNVPIELTEITSPSAVDELAPPSSSIWLLTVPQVAELYPDTRLNTSNVRISSGLTSARAAELLARDGKNELTPPKEHSELVKYLLQYTDPFNVLLLLAGILSAGVAYPLDRVNVLNLYLGVVLWIVVFLSSTFAYIQEGRASDVMHSFKSMLPSQAKVIRDGRVQSIAATEIVQGDLLQISTGDIVPADMRLVWTQDCKVETSSLTGESLPITCSLRSADALKMEQARNMCFNSSKCLEGESWGVVTATGERSLIGQIANLAGTTKTEPTTLQKEIALFVRNLSIGAICLGIVFFVVGMARGQDWIFAFINGFIVVLIACIPQGLPMTVVSCLTITSRRLSEKHVFVKQLQSVETLGSVTVIASDKTGTLTQNVMSVANLWFDRTSHSAASVMEHYPAHRLHGRKAMMSPTNSAVGNRREYHLGATLEQLELVSVICSKTRFEDERQLSAAQAQELEQVEMFKALDPSQSMRRKPMASPRPSPRPSPHRTPSALSSRSRVFPTGFAPSSVVLDDSQRTVVGDASETALFNYVRQRQSIELLRFHHQKVYDVPFNSRNKFALSVTKPVALLNHSPDARTLLMKGAPEVVLARCSHYMYRGEVKELDERFHEEFTEAYERFGSLGQRVLGFAQLALPEEHFGSKFDSEYCSNPQALPSSGLVFIGLISLVDPPKESVPQAVLDCRSAGIKVIMVTGDHPLTAAAIARQTNIFGSGHYTREELAEIHDVDPDHIDEDEIDCVVVTGPELDRFTPADWDRVLSKEDIVFARTTPQNKLTIVEALQARGHVVAATGDGVNDSPALKKADIGVAMGINGSDVARDAAAVILMDDNFASIVVGVREGRTIFDNLTKTIAYSCTHLWPEAVPVLLTLACGFPLALSALLILTIDLFTELPPAISLASEPTEADVMSRPPRDSKSDRLVTWQVVGYVLGQAGIIETASCLLGFFLVFDWYGMTPSSLYDTPYFKGNSSPDMPFFLGCARLGDRQSEAYPRGGVCFTADEQEHILRQAQTCYFALLTSAQAAHIWLCKTRTASVWSHGLLRNDLTLWGVVIEICLVVLIIFPPSSHALLTSEPFPPHFWPLILVAPAALALWQEGRKYFVRRHPDSFIAKYVHW